MTLYGATGSGSAAIEAALALLGVDYRRVDSASWEPGPGHDELLRVSPLGQVPVLVLDDGTVLSESAAILLSLAERYPDSGLMPRDQAQRDRSMRGLVFIAANCYAAVGLYDYPERWCQDCDEATRARIQAGTRARLHRLWEIFADQMAPSPWLAGAEIGAVDLLASVVSRWSGSRAHLGSARPWLAELLGRVDSDPRLAPVFERHWPAR